VNAVARRRWRRLGGRCGHRRHDRSDRPEQKEREVLAQSRDQDNQVEAPQPPSDRFSVDEKSRGVIGGPKLCPQPRQTEARAASSALDNLRSSRAHVLPAALELGLMFANELPACLGVGLKHVVLLSDERVAAHRAAPLLRRLGDESREAESQLPAEMSTPVAASLGERPGDTRELCIEQVRVLSISDEQTGGFRVGVDHRHHQTARH
jgi:hypothetical protein